LRVIIPGLFGYRMDTPDGGQYWGTVGALPGMPHGRHSGSGEYAGILVVLLAVWAGAQSFQRGETNLFNRTERRFIWFWIAAAVVALLLAYGRHAPFYQLIYPLPFVSVLRNPIKYMHPIHMGLLVVIAYGLESLFRRELGGKE
jgi:hypothetical protein